MPEVIQDELFEGALKTGRPISLYLKTGVPVRGKVRAHDGFTVLLEQEGRSILVYKHSITSVLGARPGQRKK
ncbi:MAG TPA: RNA chaperone Hfq [Leptospiraceae bacterium]|jgi:host factor-I protein|nr:RNA chaperone Hfq [Leptospirales bacterium]HMU82689.1 RNA chaperone Hfq [Leptospiraceae bacterium]HMW60600.1 RNA chaperone Hfq [Leptospiraceae bacterium]HMX54991.1 RNA chaperone Hfq [Leptospiraceae bacterium]HMY46678.1 RNA chaperone Hfq [Leptospiraceae bacterium]